MFYVFAQMLSFFLITHSPTPASLPWHSPTLRRQAFTGPRASPPIMPDKTILAGAICPAMSIPWLVV